MNERASLLRYTYNACLVYRMHVSPQKWLKNHMRSCTWRNEDKNQLYLCVFYFIYYVRQKCLFSLINSNWFTSSRKSSFFLHKILCVLIHQEVWYFTMCYYSLKDNVKSGSKPSKVWGKLTRKRLYICSPTKYTECFNEWVYSSRMLAQHVSDLTGPSSGACCTSCITTYQICKYSL